ncbi:transcription factor HIVEP3 [Brachionichthys hirsutus]|uniref:transcription factor HIVEP3 n=1 Tax=Brachionichthys hirsutus TaxID=412623 RepID=UPI003604A2E8
MEALHSCLTTGEQSGGQELFQPESHCRGLQPKSPSQPRRQQQASSTKPHGTSQQAKQSKRQHPERKRLRQQRQSIDSDTTLESKHEAKTATKATAVSSLSPGVPSSSTGDPIETKPETQETTPKQKRERKPQRPGKYVCTYCGRACAKPSVLQKHIRSHTGERPYPCAPCGFSFKTKSNLYKHRKSHTHRVKAGLALGEPRSVEEQVTESEDETRQLSSALSHSQRQSSVASIKSYETDRSKDCTGGNNDSYAVKKRLALRLSRGKHGSQDSSDEKALSLISGSKGSTESGYFSRSESTEQSLDSPINTSAKSYAEIILGKCGSLGHLQRMPRQHNQQPSGEEEKSIPFTVPKKQVIDHITKLITINEAVVDTSKIDSVKPRRFSLSRKNSSESQKSSSMKEQLVQSPKAADLGYKSSGSITMGVPCEKFHHPSLNMEQPPGQTSAPLVRSHSMPTAASSFDTGCGPSKFRPSQSFDERKASERPASRRYGMLRRQPAIEIPLCAELGKEEHEGSPSFCPDSLTTMPDPKPIPPKEYECEACGIGCKDWEGYKRHKQSLCLVHQTRNEIVISQMDCSQLISYSARARVSAMRKRRKEDSFEFDETTSPSLPSPALVSGHCKDESNAIREGPRRPTPQTCSVIQHTSSFEKQESLCNEIQGAETTKNSPPPEEYQLLPQKQHQEPAKLANRKLVHQHNVQVPEILVTEDSNTSTGISIEANPKAKHLEKLDEFQWPQRSPSLSQLPIEKLPPKKKRLRLAEATQSSGESSFDSMSLPHSPTQDSSASYASSRSTSFEDSNRPDMELTTLTPLRKSRASDMLTVPGVHQHREMRRSASEQAPHDPQPSVLVTETRSKSFDYSCMSPERTAAGWKERRKCLLMRHTAIRDPDEEEEEQGNLPTCSPKHIKPSISSLASPTSVYCSQSSTAPVSGERVLPNPVKEILSQWNLKQNIQLTGSPALSLSAETVKEVSNIHAGQSPPQAPQPFVTHGPSGAARARYLPMSTGLKLEIPLLHDAYPVARVSQSLLQRSVPHISPSQELLRPVASPAVAVRLQTDTLTLGCAIYTTLSQVTSSTPEEKTDVVSQSIGAPIAEYRGHGDTSPNVQLWPDVDLRIPGSGGNKRVLSPSNSIEIHPESQQQQKRVKEREEREVGCVDKASMVTCCQELKGEKQPCLPSICSPNKHDGSSFPSLLSSTSNSWCYLNYIKPSPSALDKQKPSVYSAWSTGSYDPNPPGLSSKTALSLLHCKQRLSPSIYTISPMTEKTPEPVESEDKRRPCPVEVCNSRSYCRDHEGSRKEQHPAASSKLNQEEEREDNKKTEKVQLCSRSKPPPELWISDRRSNEKYEIVHVEGVKKSQCEDCGFQFKNTSARQKCIQGFTELPERSCKCCEASFMAKGSVTKDLESQGAETGCYQAGTDQGVCKEPSIQSDKEKDRQCSDQGKSGHDEDAKVTKGRSDLHSRSKVPESANSSPCDGEKSLPVEQPMEPELARSTQLPPEDPGQTSSASLRRALFARRRLDASASASPGTLPSPPSFIPPREPSPPHASSPRPRQPLAAPDSLSPSSYDVTTSTQRPVSPVRGLSPVIGQSLGSESSEPSGSPAGTSAQHHTCLQPRNRSSPARLSVDEVVLSPVSPQPLRPRGSNNLLSHLPLHSQQPSRTPSLLIPIGGIHMIQPRSLLPLYSLVSSATAAAVNPAGASWRLSDTPKRSSFLPLRQSTLQEMLAGSPSSPPDPGADGSGTSEVVFHRKSQGRFSIQQPSETETRCPEVTTDTHTDKNVNPETT